MIYLLQGFLYGIAYVAPIGTQNLYVMNIALNSNKKKALFGAFVTSFWDISLALLCFFGVGYLIEEFYILKLLMLFIGSLFIFMIGISLYTKKIQITYDTDTHFTIKKIITTCFIVTFFNPQAIIDGTLILGSVRASLLASQATYFILGTTAASLSWFVSLSLLITHFKGYISLNIFKAINKLASIILVIYGIKLGYHFINGLLLIF